MFCDQWHCYLSYSKWSRAPVLIMDQALYIGLLFCSLNADEALMLVLIPKSQRWSHRSVLNHTGFMARPIHCVVITKKDIRGVAPAHSSEEPWCSPRAPRGLEAAQRGSLSKSLAQTHSRAPHWPRVGPGRSHQGSQVRTALIAPAETMSGNDA